MKHIIDEKEEQQKRFFLQAGKQENEKRKKETKDPNQKQKGVSMSDTEGSIVSMKESMACSKDASYKCNRID